MDTKKLGKSGKIFTFDRDHNILTTIRTSNLIETNFQKIAPEDSLGNLVETIAKSKRNIFPVTDKENKLLKNLR